MPYTDALLATFRGAILAWFGDLLTSFPAIAKGRAYFALSPEIPAASPDLGGLPVGLGSDLAYFGAEMAAHLAQGLLMHPDLVAVRR